MIKIFTDSTAYIPEDLREKYDITVIPLTITINNKKYLETELPNSLFYELAEKTGETPEINAPSIEYVKTLFKKETDEGNSVLGIFISAKTSKLFSIAEKAKQSVLKTTPEAKIYLIDSETNSMHMGLSVLAAAETNAQNQWLENVAKAAYDIMKRSRYLFIPSKLKYLSQTGNIDKAPAIISDIVQLRPILSPVKGEIVPLETIITQKKAVDKMVAMMDDDAKHYGISRIVISHINAPDKAEELKQRLSDRVATEIVISSIGPSIGYYVGPGTIGIVYQTKDVHPMNDHIVIPKILS